MKKYAKGTNGYLDHKKKMEILRTMLYFAIVAAVFFLGYSQTHSRKNLLTVVAVVGCLPACKALVGVIVRLPYRSLAPETAAEIAGKTAHLTVLYELLLTSTEKIMPTDCIILYKNTLIGYAPSQKTDLKKLTDYIRKALKQNRCADMNVKFYKEYKQFLTKAEELERLAAAENGGGSGQEEETARLLLTMSM